MRGSVITGAAALACALGAATAAAAALSWRYSTVLVTPRARVEFGERVLGATDTTVVLRRSRAVAQPGVWGLRFPGPDPGRPGEDDGRLVVIGDVLEAGRRHVVRRLLDGEPPPVGPAVIDAGPFDPDPSARGLAFDDVAMRTPLGPAPAWLIPAPAAPQASDAWVVAVHGRGSSRREALRIAPALHAAGLHQLVISYRNDECAAAAPDGRYHLGDTEWRDLEAAVRFALGRGARRIVLFGWSMGAAICGAFLDRSAAATHVAAVVWDAPLLDWRSTMRQQAANRHLPRSLAGPALAITARRIGIDVDRFDLRRHPPAVRPPTLVLHSDADTTVPVADGRALAAAAPGLGWPLRYREVRGVEHTASWNADPAGYERAVTGFIAGALPGG